MFKFILGILFAYFALPLLDSFGSLLTTWIESLKGNSSIKIAEFNRKVTELSDDSPKTAIGFAIPDSYENEDEDNEY